MEDRYIIKQYTHFPERRLTDKKITSFDVLKEALAYAEEYNIVKDTNEIRPDKYGIPRHIGNYIHAGNKGYYILDRTKISSL